jgi:hypothetical protein
MLSSSDDVTLTMPGFTLQHTKQLEREFGELQQMQCMPHHSGNGRIADQYPQAAPRLGHLAQRQHSK